MIQRIQTVYLLGAVLVCGLLPIFLNLWKNVDGVVVLSMELINRKAISLKLIPILFILSTVVSIVTILKYKNRQNQFVLGRINILINLIILGFLVYHLQSLSGLT